jgi:hypothetical protein
LKGCIDVKDCALKDANHFSRKGNQVSQELWGQYVQLEKIFVVIKTKCFG